MTNDDTMIAMLERQAARRRDRRSFFRVAGSAAVAAGGLSLLTACNGNDGTTPVPAPSPTPTPTATPASTDQKILNFALNLEYLEASFYAYAVYGEGLSSGNMMGTGTQGTVTGGRQVNFTDPLVAQYAREIAQDEVEHVNFLRAALGSAAVAIPSIDISASGAFTAAARAAGVVDANTTFDPYASDENFLLGAYIFEDVGVTAYKGAAPLITNATYLDAAAGILAAEAYHAGLVRTVLYRKGIDASALITAANKISDARDSLDGASDDDQGLTIMANGQTMANIVPTDSNGIAFSRTVEQVHNIAYLTANAASKGGFFPNGTNNPDPAFTMSGDSSTY
jgi:hypothetical protein